MAESEKIKSSQVIDENLFTKQIKESIEFAEASQLVVKGLKDIVAVNAVLLKQKGGDDAKSIKERTLAVEESKKARIAII